MFVYVELSCDIALHYREKTRHQLIINGWRRLQDAFIFCSEPILDRNKAQIVISRKETHIFGSAVRKLYKLPVIVSRLNYW